MAFIDRFIPKRAAVCSVGVLSVFLAGAAWGQAKDAPKPPPDTITFSNGDKLTGQLERGVGGNIVFKSDMAGEITVPLAKIKELHSSGSFAILRKETAKTHDTITSRTILYGDNGVTVTTPHGPEVIAVKDVSYIIDQATYDRELNHRPGPLFGWRGTATAGATFVRSTQNGSSFTGAIGLVRAIPTVPYLPARNRTIFDLAETYGKQTQPVIPQTTPPSPDIVTKTSIFHTDAERDQYFSPRLYALAQTTFDHNYSQGLTLQQVYGAGIGWTPVTTPKQQLDVKADVHYEKQAFQTASSNQNLIGSTLTEIYKRNLPLKMTLLESGNVLPAWNNSHALSANGSVAFGLPVYKRLAVTFSTTDNYLNDPSVGFKKNSFQFVTGLSYALGH